MKGTYILIVGSCEPFIYICCSVLCLFSPFFRLSDNANIFDKMIYASSKDSIKKAFSGLSLEFQANGKDGLDYDTIREEVLKKA